MTNDADGSGLPNFRNLGDAVDRSGDPDASAVIDLGAGLTARFYSYREVDALVDATARGLLAQGLTRGERVAILRPIAASFSPPSSASCAPVWSRFRSIGSCRRPASNSFCATAAPG